MPGRRHEQAEANYVFEVDKDEASVMAIPSTTPTGSPGNVRRGFKRTRRSNGRRIVGIVRVVFCESTRPRVAIKSKLPVAS